jgi:hypothetical protein
MAMNLKQTTTELFSAAVNAKVDALTNLTEEQRERVREIAIASAVKQSGLFPNLAGIANLVRSQAERPTPNTYNQNGNKI